MFLPTVFYCILQLICVDSARILGVFPMPFLSHQSVFRALTEELANRGHDLVIITPVPSLPKNRPNVTEIDMSHSLELINNVYDDIPIKRGVLIDLETAFSKTKSFVDIYASQLEHPDVKKLLSNKEQHFDLILLEAAFHVHLIFTHIFKAPAILISSFHGLPESFELVGAVGCHPIFYPNIFRQKYGGTSIVEKIRDIILEYKYKAAMKESEAYENRILEEKFGPTTPTISELKNNVDMLFINLNLVLQDNRPVPPNVVYVGPLHLQPVKALPKDLKTYLDNSKTGVIYVSLGTIVKPSKMDEDLLDSFLDAFEALSYDILWKFDGDKIKRVPKNLRTQKWFPQRDLLVHPNIKVFVTQGGLQSTDEAIDAGVPLVTIPLLAEQFFNAYKHEQLGIGVGLDVMTLDAKALIDGINKVIHDESYRLNIRKLKQLLHDQPLGPMERAVWWTEYVIRHGGAKHLRSPAANISWAEYLMADVLLALAIMLVIALFFAILVAKFILNGFQISLSSKLKRS